MAGVSISGVGLWPRRWIRATKRGLFPTTPPLEALRAPVSRAATVEGRRDGKRSVIMINGVAWAFFEAPVTREICMELPREDASEDDIKEDCAGIPRMSLHGAVVMFQRSLGKN